jgi:hypothetical protein
MMASYQLHCLTKLLASFTVVTMALNVFMLLSPPQPNHLPMYRSNDYVPSTKTRTTTRRNSNTNTTIPASIQQQFSIQSFSEEEGRRYMMDIFQRAGVTLTSEMASQLPTWSQVRRVVGDYPRVLNLSTCPTFRNTVPPLERMIGSSGMFNTGTNLVTHLLKQNCEIPERRQHYGPHQSKESYGMRWQVPVSILCLWVKQKRSLCTKGEKRKLCAMWKARQESN